MTTINELNDCGTANSHTAEWEVSMTSPQGQTGIKIRKCTTCAVKLLETPALQVGQRTLHLRKIAEEWT